MKYALALIQREATNTISGMNHYRPPTRYHCKECSKPLKARNRNPNPKKRTGLCQSCRGKSLGHSNKGRGKTCVF